MSAQQPRHAKDRHGEPALVAEEVAGCDLVEKRQPPPYGTNALEQDALARLGGTRTHELGGLLGELVAHGERRGHADAGDEHSAGKCAQAGREVQGEGREGVHEPEEHEQELR